MAKHEVKCPYCNIVFDTNKEEFVQLNRRYAHKSCYDAAGGQKTFLKNPEAPPKAKKKKEESPSNELTSLKDYIDSLYGSYANWPMIMKQIKQFQEKGYSLSGIEKSLRYFYEVKGNKVSESNGGIGIVDFCYQPAYNYYLSIFLAKRQNENKTLIQTIKEYIIKPPKRRGTKQKFFKIEEEESEKQ